MIRSTRQILIILVVVICGCTVYRPGVFPDANRLGEGGRSGNEIREGSQVVVHMKSGGTDHGSVLGWTNDVLTLERSDGLGRGGKTIDREDIEVIEIVSKSELSIFVALVAAMSLYWFASGLGPWGES